MTEKKPTNGRAKRKGVAVATAPDRPWSRRDIHRIDEREIVRTPDGVTAGVNVAPIYAAIEALTGVSPWDLSAKGGAQHQPEIWHAIQVVTSAITTLVAPDEVHTRWLAKVPRLRPFGGKNEGRTHVVAVLRMRLGRADLRVRESMATKDDAFLKLTTEQEKQTLTFLRGPRNVHAVAARFSLRCGAFGDAQRKNESLERAIQRVATTYREAERDAKHTH